jgi:hypothetical protein
MSTWPKSGQLCIYYLGSTSQNPQALFKEANTLQ